MKCKSWSNKINNFVVRRLKSIKSNGPQQLPTTSSTCATSPATASSSPTPTPPPLQQQQQQQQYLSNCCSNTTMPAMPKEKATAVSINENNFSELKLKELTTSAAAIVVSATAVSAAAAMASTATANPVSTTSTPASCRQQNAAASAAVVVQNHAHHNHHQQQQQQQQQHQRNICGCGNASANEVTMRNKFMTNGHSSPLSAAMATQNSSPSSSPHRLSTSSIASNSGSNNSANCCRQRYQQQQTNGVNIITAAAATTDSEQEQHQQQISDIPPLASSQISSSLSSSMGGATSSFASSSVSSNASTSLYPSKASPPLNTAAITPPKRSPKDYIFGKYIGEGSFSVVYLAVDIITKREYAIKVCEKRQILREHKQEYIRREREVLHMLTNVPGFVNLSCTFQCPRSLYFVMTYVKNGDLLPYINKVGSFDIDSTRHYAAELVLACEQMHRRNIVHRDLKPENILLDEDMHTLVADFGSVKIMTAEERQQANAFLLSGGMDLTRKTRCHTGGSSMGSDDDEITNDDEEEDYESTDSSGSCGDADVGGDTDSPRARRQQSRYHRKRRSSFVGTAQYVSPEVLQNAPITPASDLWALGCIIYQMMSGLPPFRANIDYNIFKEILACNLDFPQGFDKDAEDLVTKLLKLNPAERLGAQDMNGRYESIRSHAFFKGIDFEKVRQTTPPPISPFLPDLIKEEEEFTICENLEPGLDEKQLTRLLGMELGCISDDDGDRKKTATIKPKSAINTNNTTLTATTTTTATTTSVRASTTTPAMAARTVNNSQQKSAKNSFDLSDLEKHQRLEAQKSDKWHAFADGEVILKKGFVNKRKGLFARRRMLLLTTGPRLIYIDPVQMVKKGEIPWSPELRAEAKNFKIFFVHTPNRTYYLDDPEGYGLEWVAALEKMSELTYNGQMHTSNTNSNNAATSMSSSSRRTTSTSSGSTNSLAANSNRLAALHLNNNNNNNNNHSHSTNSVTKTSSAISASSIAHKTSSLLTTPFSIMKTASN